MTIENIVSFVYLSRFKSFQKAADALYITQPTFSSRIKSLENDLGCQLVNRKRRGVELTEKGEKFLPYAVRIFDIYLEMQDTLRQEGQDIVIGTIRTVALSILPEILSWIQQKIPDAFISVITRSTPILLDSLLSQECQVAITEHINHSEIIAIPIFRDQISLYAAASHPLCKRTQPLSLNDIAHLKNICCNRGSTFWPSIEDFFQKRHLHLVPNYDIDTLEGLKNTILGGTAIGFLPEMTTKAEVNLGKLVRLPADPELMLYREICVAYLKSEKPTYIDSLINYMQSVPR